jgi:hypothetical protein
MADAQTPAVAPRITAEARYSSLETFRNPFLMRARHSALLTIPGLMPPDSSSGSNTFYQPFNSLGARGLNNLAAKLLLALFPAGSSFFRLAMDDYVVAKLADQTTQDGTDPRATFENALSKVERAVITRMEQKGCRLPIFECLKQLIVAGNALLQVMPDSSLVLHRLDSYVVKRDPAGAVVEIVLKQMLSRMTLPEQVRAIVDAQQPLEGQPTDQSQDNTIALFTRVTRRVRKGAKTDWAVSQEVLGTTVPGTEGYYPLDKSPWLPLRFSAVPNEDYGRGFIEEYIGDLNSLEDATESIIRFGKVASKILFMVNEAGVTSKKSLQDSVSGDIIDGDVKDVGILMLEKFMDFKIQKEVADGIEKRLEQAFLLNSSVQRQAERVTAEEIRFVAAELEQALGGVYSVFAQELQRPLVVRVMVQMQKERKLPALPEAAVSPQIVTGLEALGRNADLQKLDILVEGVETHFGQDQAADYINVAGYIERRGAALGIDTKGIIRSADEVAKMQQQRAAQSLTEKLGPHAIKAASQAQASEPTPQ